MLINKRQRKLNGKSRIDNTEKLKILGKTQEEDKKKKKTHTAQA